MADSGSSRGRLVVVAVIIALAAGAIVFFTTRNAEAGEVTLASSTATGAEPFFDPDAPTSPPTVTPVTPGGSEPAATPSGSPAPSTAPPTTGPGLPPPPQLAKLGAVVTGLYGGTGLNTQCDRNKLISFLAAHIDKAQAWASTLGVATSQIGTFINKLVPVVIKEDMRVTNHGFHNGTANPFQSILQAGSAILVDLFGKPVVRCKCGNPLGAAKPVKGKVRYKGVKWSGFDPDRAIDVFDVVRTRVVAPPSIIPSRAPTPKKTPTAPPPKIVNLSSGASASASKSTPGFGPALGVDGDVTTSWFSRGPEKGGSKFTITLAKPSVVTRVEFVNNSRNSTGAFRSGFGFGAWTVELLGKAGQVLYKFDNSAAGTASQNRQVPGIRGVATVRFIGTGHQSSTCGGFAELRVIGYRLA